MTHAPETLTAEVAETNHSEFLGDLGDSALSEPVGNHRTVDDQTTSHPIEAMIAPSPSPHEVPVSPHLMKSMSSQAALIDPTFVALWARFEAVCNRINFVGQLQPQDAVENPEPSPANYHAVPTLVLGLSGITKVAARQTISLVPGELLLIEPGVWHHHLDAGPGDASLGIGFFGGRCDVYFSTYGSWLWGWVPEEPYATLVQRLMFASKWTDRHSLIASLFASLTNERIYSVNFRNPAVQSMVSCMWSHAYDPDHHVDDLVKQSGIPRSKLFHVFRSVFGRTPKQEVLANRISIAHHLMQRGMTVTEAAQQTGFSCRSDLTRAYRRVRGHTPTIAKEQHRLSVRSATDEVTGTACDHIVPDATCALSAQSREEQPVSRQSR